MYVLQTYITCEYPSDSAIFLGWAYEGRGGRCFNGLADELEGRGRRRFNGLADELEGDIAS